MPNYQSNSLQTSAQTSQPPFKKNKILQEGLNKPEENFHNTEKKKKKSEFFICASSKNDNLPEGAQTSLKYLNFLKTSTKFKFNRLDFQFKFPKKSSNLNKSSGCQNFELKGTTKFKFSKNAILARAKS